MEKKQNDDITTRVMKIIAKFFPNPKVKITEDTSFISDLEADSLSIMEVIMGLEEEFHIRIDDDDAKNMKTARDVILYIQKNLPKE